MKTVVITGASSGIGFETARLLSKNYSVIGIGHNKSNCERAKGLIKSENPNADVIYFVADLIQQNEVTRVADEVASYIESFRKSELYCLINNAGCVRRINPLEFVRYGEIIEFKDNTLKLMIEKEQYRNIVTGVINYDRRLN